MKYPYLTGWCGTGQHEVCRLRWSGPCACPCGHVAPVLAAVEQLAPTGRYQQLPLCGEGAVTAPDGWLPGDPLPEGAAHDSYDWTVDVEISEGEAA